METLARWVSNRTIAWGIVLVVALGTAASLLQLRQLKNEDDVLAFLPQDNPDVGLFYDINKRFGGLDLALVGLEVADPFDPEFLRKLQRLTQSLKDSGGLDHVLSLANVVDFTPDRERGGVITAPLVQHLPESPEQRAALREKVMSRDHVVGNLISADGQAVLIYNFLAYGVDPKVMAGRIQGLVHEEFPDLTAYWGGGPFISTYIYDTTQKDLKRLTPWAVLAIVVIILLAFRDWIGATLALLTTGIGIAVTLGLMAVFAVPFNIVLSAMPIILFAIGSAYGIHLLARYYLLAEKLDTTTALRRTLVGLGPVVLAAGLTTVASLMSFVFMDIKPIRTFGFFTALGILITLVLSLTFIPAVVGLTNLRRKQTESLQLRKAMVRLTVFAQRHRRAVGLSLLALASVCVFWVTRVNTAVDQTTFFTKDSPPDRADKFLARHFGGGQFIQLFVQGNLADPAVLREVRRIADRIATHPKVSAVRHVGEALALSNKAMVGQLRIPDTEAQVRMLYSFMLGDPAVAQLVSPNRDQGLVHIQVSSNRAEDLESVLDFAEQTVASTLIGRYEIVSRVGPRRTEVDERQREILTWRLVALARFYGLALPGGVESRMRYFLSTPAPVPARDQIRAEMLRFLKSEECALDLGSPEFQPRAPLAAEAGAEPGVGPQAGDLQERLAATLANLDNTPDEAGLLGLLAGLLGRPTGDQAVEDLALSILTPLQEARRGSRASQRADALIANFGLQVPPGAKGERFVSALGAAFWDQDNDTALLPAAPSQGTAQVAGASLQMQANGLPVLHRGLSRSVEANQIKSMIFAVLVIVLILSLLFRSLWTGLLAATPTLLTLVVIYGGMGLLKVHLDIGTSMLASIILGVGVDYAVHLLAAWHPNSDGSLASSAANAADHTGPAIWTNAIMIFFGFFVLTMGEARPLQNVGGLTAAAMLVAALATFLAIPVLARKRRYRANQACQEELDCSEAVDAVLSKALPIKS